MSAYAPVIINSSYEMRTYHTLSQTSIAGGPLLSFKVSPTAAELLVLLTSCCLSSVMDRRNTSAHSTTDQTLWSLISNALSPSALPTKKSQMMHRININGGLLLLLVFNPPNFPQVTLPPSPKRSNFWLLLECNFLQSSLSPNQQYQCTEGRAQTKYMKYFYGDVWHCGSEMAE